MGLNNYKIKQPEFTRIQNFCKKDCMLRTGYQTFRVTGQLKAIIFISHPLMTRTIVSVQKENHHDRTKSLQKREKNPPSPLIVSWLKTSWRTGPGGFLDGAAREYQRSPYSAYGIPISWGRRGGVENAEPKSPSRCHVLVPVRGTRIFQKRGGLSG